MSTIPDVSPMFDLVVVIPDTSGDRKRGPIHIPDAHQPITANDERSYVKTHEKVGVGVVLEVGRGARIEDGQGRVPPDVKPGDRVAYVRAEASPIGLHGDRRVIVREASIVGVLDS